MAVHCCYCLLMFIIFQQAKMSRRLFGVVSCLCKLSVCMFVYRLLLCFPVIPLVYRTSFDFRSFVVLFLSQAMQSKLCDSSLLQIHHRRSALTIIIFSNILIVSKPLNQKSVSINTKIWSANTVGFQWFDDVWIPISRNQSFSTSR